MRVRPDRVAKLIDRIDAILASDRMPPAVRASITGKLQWTLSWVFGKFGRACLQPIISPMQAAGASLPPAVRLAFEYLTEVLPELPPHVLSLRPNARTPTLVWSDGMQQGGGMAVGFLVGIPRDGRVPRRAPTDLLALVQIAEDYTFMHGCDDVPAPLVDALRVRTQQIGQIEIIGGLCPYLSCPSSFADRQVLHWIDNTSALSALTRGYSGVPDSVRLVHTFHAFNLGLRAQVWFEYVCSESNPSDEPSRRVDLIDRVWRFSPSEPRLRSSPVPCVFPQAHQLADSASWIRGGLSHTVHV